MLFVSYKASLYYCVDKIQFPGQRVSNDFVMTSLFSSLAQTFILVMFRCLCLESDSKHRFLFSNLKLNQCRRAVPLSSLFQIQRFVFSFVVPSLGFVSSVTADHKKPRKNRKLKITCFSLSHDLIYYLSQLGLNTHPYCMDQNHCMRTGSSIIIYNPNMLHALLLRH